MISLDKTYKTESGSKVVIYAIYPDNLSQQVQGAIVYTNYTQMNSWNLDGRFHEGIAIDTSCLDLVEVSPYEDWKIDDKVVVWNNDWVFDGEVQKVNKYFAGLDDSNLPTAFANGATSWSNESNECRRYVYDNIERVEAECILGEE